MMYRKIPGKIVNLFCVLNFMLTACRPNFIEITPLSNIEQSENSRYIRAQRGSFQCGDPSVIQICLNLTKNKPDIRGTDRMI
jgi:hypothetical protein